MTAACGTLGTRSIANGHRWLGLGPTKEDLMKGLITLGAFGLLVAAASAFGQEPVTGAADVEALFTSPDPKLHRNKQTAYHIQRDLLEAGHWELADRWLTERYVQHNPNAASG